MSLFDVIPLQAETDFLWRAIDLLVQEVGHQPTRSQGFLDAWEKLAREVNLYRQDPVRWFNERRAARGDA